MIYKKVKDMAIKRNYRETRKAWRTWVYHNNLFEMTQQEISRMRQAENMLSRCEITRGYELFFEELHNRDYQSLSMWETRKDKNWFLHLAYAKQWINGLSHNYSDPNFWFLAGFEIEAKGIPIIATHFFYAVAEIVDGFCINPAIALDGFRNGACAAQTGRIDAQEESKDHD